MKRNKSSSQLSSQELQQLLKICADMDEVSGNHDDFLALLEESANSDELEDSALHMAAGGVCRLYKPHKDEDD